MCVCDLDRLYMILCVVMCMITEQCDCAGVHMFAEYKGSCVISVVYM